MNKAAIKRFAIEARKKLMASVIDQAGLLGITHDGCREPINKGAGFAVYRTTANTEITLYGDEIKYRQQLVSEMKIRGFEAVMEEVAYTWFNRMIAIRFMEVNDYLPTRVRVLSSEKEGKVEPDLLTLAPDVDMDFSMEEKEYILTAKSENRLDELFRMLFIKQCQELHSILPELFEETDDYTEMLLNISFTNRDDVVRMLIDEVEEENFDLNARDEEGNPIGQVEIIGWLYQYYNTELKDDTFAQLKKNVKITKERIPAATQLFTPDWIVRYMVENSLGRLWMEHLRANNPAVDEKEVAERFGWSYYLPEAEQEEEVKLQLVQMRKSYKDMQPTDIVCIDPCMGSGHILVYMFDVLMDIYKSVGYREREAAFEIVEHNIHGLDIDKRAYQLAYFAVMMKGRGYNRRFFRGREVTEEGREYVKYPRPMLCAMEESNGLPVQLTEELRVNFGTILTSDDLEGVAFIKDFFSNAREYGSLLNLDGYSDELIEQCLKAEEKLTNLYQSMERASEESTLNLVQMILIKDIHLKIRKLILQTRILRNKYDVVCTNPPYKKKSDLNENLSSFMEDMFESSCNDLFAAFIERCNQFTKNNGFQAMITQQSWMFSTEYTELRSQFIQNYIINMAHLGTKAFDEISGEKVQTTSFVLRKTTSDQYSAQYLKLLDFCGENQKRMAYLNRENLFLNKIATFQMLDEYSFAYWISNEMINILQRADKLVSFANCCTGMQTGRNPKYIRNWYEIKIEDLRNEDSDWKKYNCGGEVRRWYGNHNNVVYWKDNGSAIRQEKSSVIRNERFYFREGISWKRISGQSVAFRYLPEGFIFDQAGDTMFPLNEAYMRYILAFTNSSVCKKYLEYIAPTLNLTAGNMNKVPLLMEEHYLHELNELVDENIQIAKNDWDAFEVSWDFCAHPLLQNGSRLEAAFANWKKATDMQFEKMRRNEERINVIFSEIYGLQDECDTKIEDEFVTLRKADVKRDVQSLISYAIGCIFGRYSLNQDGVVYAGGEWKSRIQCGQYGEMSAKEDGILPLTEEVYFQDDMVERFFDFMKVVFGTEHFDENMNYIVSFLECKGESAREAIQNYFMKEFYPNHYKLYQKTPIYWLFDSGKENAFKALIYMHHYDADTVGRIRTEYLHKTQAAIENAMKSAQYTIDNATSSTEKSKATKKLTKLTKQLAETRLYDQALAHVANQRLEINLDDGVKINYAKFQGIEVAQEGKKPVKIDLLAKIK